MDQQGQDRARVHGEGQDVISRHVLPDAVVAVEMPVGPSVGAWPPLHPEEASALGVVVEKRFAEFAVGRWCSRRALREIGAPERPLLPGPNREPMWPPGFVGSISHCEGYCIAAVARSEDSSSVGIDIEPDEPLPDGVIDQITSQDEGAWVAEGPRLEHRGRLLFSAKESVYKAWFPLTGTWLGFEDVRLTFSPDQASFGVQAASDLHRAHQTLLASFEGRCARARGLIVTSVVVPT